MIVLSSSDSAPVNLNLSKVNLGKHFFFAHKMCHTPKEWEEWIDGMDEEGSHGYSKKEWQDWWEEWPRQRVQGQRASSYSEPAQGQPAQGQGASSPYPPGSVKPKAKSRYQKPQLCNECGAECGPWPYSTEDYPAVARCFLMPRFCCSYKCLDTYCIHKCCRSIDGSRQDPPPGTG